MPAAIPAATATNMGHRSSQAVSLLLPILSHSWRAGENRAGCSQGYFVFVHPGFHVLPVSTLEKFSGNKVEL